MKKKYIVIVYLATILSSKCGHETSCCLTDLKAKKCWVHDCSIMPYLPLWHGPLSLGFAHGQSGPSHLWRQHLEPAAALLVLQSASSICLPLDGHRLWSAHLVSNNRHIKNKTHKQHNTQTKTEKALNIYILKKDYKNTNTWQLSFSATLTWWFQ